MNDFNDFNLSVKNDFFNIDDILLSDEKFEHFINSNLIEDEFFKFANEEFDPEETLVASETEYESLEIENILFDQTEKKSDDLLLIDDIVKEEYEIQENPSELVDHKEKSPAKLNSSSKFKCDSCNWETFTKSNYKRHLGSKKHQKLAQQSYQIVIEEIFVDEIPDDLDVPQLQHECTDCNKIFFMKKDLNTHIRQIHLLMKCSKCSRRFRNEKELSLHMDRHKKSSDFTCSKCPKSFSNRQNLLRHEKTHINKNFFECIICNKFFGQKTNLMRHLNIHKM